MTKLVKGSLWGSKEEMKQFPQLRNQVLRGEKNPYKLPPDTLSYVMDNQKPRTNDRLTKFKEENLPHIALEDLLNDLLNKISAEQSNNNENTSKERKDADKAFARKLSEINEYFNPILSEENRKQVEEYGGALLDEIDNLTKNKPSSSQVKVKAIFKRIMDICLGKSEKVQVYKKPGEAQFVEYPEESNEHILGMLITRISSVAKDLCNHIILRNNKNINEKNINQYIDEDLDAFRQGIDNLAEKAEEMDIAGKRFVLLKLKEYQDPSHRNLISKLLATSTVEDAEIAGNNLIKDIVSIYHIVVNANNSIVNLIKHSFKNRMLFFKYILSNK